MSDPKENTPGRSQDRLMATVSHELRTPINGIIGMAALLEETGLDANQESYVRTIRRSAGQLLDMLNNVLDFARLSDGRLQLSLAPCRPGDLAQDVCELLAPRAHDKGLDLAVRLAPDLPLEIETDGTRLRQILFNLVGNAIKFTDHGSVLIDIVLDGDEICLSVIDTGPGIAPAAQERLFEAFRQARLEDAAKDSGVGLGLAISRTLTEALGGQLDLFSVPGCGSRFSLRLPATKGAVALPSIQATKPLIGLMGLPPATSLSLAAALQSAGRRAVQLASDERLPARLPLLVDLSLQTDTLDRLFERHPSVAVLRSEDRALIPELRQRGCLGYLVRPVRQTSLQSQLAAMDKGAMANLVDERSVAVEGEGRSILLAEDNAVNALIARRALEKAGFRVTVVSTGQEAVDVATGADFDLILMDLRMPVMNGFDAMERIAAMKPELPMVAVSAEIDPDIERRARQSGASGVAQKPLESETLLHVADRWTRASETAA